MSDLCVLCARRGKATRLDSGHVCTDCAMGLMRSLNQVLRLAEDAAGHVEPGSPTGGRTPGFGSRPPLSIDALDARAGLPTTPRYDGQPMPPTLLETLESWCRMIREERRYSPYGVVSESTSSPDGLSTSLASVVTFLRREVPWMTTEPEFPIEDFADEVHECVASMWRWHRDRRAGSAWHVDCPSDRVDGICGRELTITGHDVRGTVTCPRCRREWSVEWLMRVAATTAGSGLWLDADATCAHLGIDRRTLARWVREGRVSRHHGLYDARALFTTRREEA